ncbi:DNA helicase UvrD [Pedobacter antarcticus 4BY]|uniref:DNA 3'-5' helicase n=2 Tax=Pedobacter antarcticus TaxID=34086 RepID=A0A081PJE4_9SPHI|nr:UvrD-helicase domain-containing protein [Pedobacter antarcticus]KEQ30817.1 DNA helicase UvrD [Pedobacter antarcticus 4BY]SFE66710.1 ATP-dependent exoDNAse (exonuclease V) beta subunit (contains helicase and exonuclease domains) [Pedobacter antarcticus]
MPLPLKILQASAGSGKTFSLTAHYLTLLLSAETKYREILAVTFTNKATEEMKGRIMEVLRGFAIGDSGVQDYRELVLKAHAGMTTQQLQEKSEKIYKRILHDYSRFSISTIDGFVQKVIRGFAFELGLDSGYALEMNFEKVKNELADKLDEQLDTNPALLTWIIELAMDRISNNISWNYRAELTELAGELFKERYLPFDQAIQDLVQQTDLNDLFSQYSKQTRKRLRDFEDQVQSKSAEAALHFENSGVSPDQLKGKSRSPLLNLSKIAVGDTEKIGSLAKLIDEPEEWFKDSSYDSLYDQLNPRIRDLYTFYQQELPDYILAQAFQKNLYYLRLMQEMAILLKTYREESGNLLISDAQNLLKGITGEDDDNPAFIWEKTGSRYKHFLFDEFQDTSANQWANFRPLLKNAMAEADGTLIDHLIVGDVKQSIYRWRNGDWNILHQQAKKDIGAGYVVDANLEENYRSTANIINFNNMLYKALPILMQQQINQTVAEQDQNLVLQEWWNEKGYHHIMPGVYAEAEQQMNPRTLPGGTIDIRVMRTDADGAALNKTTFRAAALDGMVTTLKRLIQDEKRYLPGDACVLVRSNSEAVSVVDALMAAQINVISGEALLLANNTAVKLLINTFLVMTGPPTNTALYKANCISLYAQIRGVENVPSDLFRLKDKNLEDLSSVLPPDLCLNWRAWMQQPLGELMEKLLRAYGLDKPENSSHLPYLFALRDLAGNIARQGERGLSAFLTYWEEEGGRKTLPSSESSDAVQVITIHKSKGLAFKVILIPFCNWDTGGKTNSIFWVPAAGTPYEALRQIPLKYTASLGQSAVAIAYYEELLYNQMDALNMLYVATTRTKEYLYISCLGKKSAGLTNIGDLIAFMLQDDLSEEGQFLVDEPVPVKKIVAKEGPVGVHFPAYPVSDRLSAVFDADLKRKKLDMLLDDTAGREGSILHEVLARAENADEIELVLEQMLEEGLFKAQELEAFRLQALQVLGNTQLAALLEQSTAIRNEKSIIDAYGKSYRPDKVLFAGDRVIVIDYKFTAQKSKKHITQVHGYRELLQQMGYPDVSTYLFYARIGELILV